MIIAACLYVLVGVGVFSETVASWIGRIVAAVLWPAIGAFMLGELIGKKLCQ